MSDSEHHNDDLIRAVAFGPDGLVTAVARCVDTGEVLMVAHMDEEALRFTLSTGFVHYHSRSRGRLWKKGESSGHVQEVVEIRLDCDGDAILLTVRQKGVACHVGYRSCFHREATTTGWCIAKGQPPT